MVNEKASTRSMALRVAEIHDRAWVVGIAITNVVFGIPGWGLMLSLLVVAAADPRVVHGLCPAGEVGMILLRPCLVHETIGKSMVGWIVAHW